jgi:hypothetical protein
MSRFGVIYLFMKKMVSFLPPIINKMLLNHILLPKMTLFKAFKDIL